MKIRKHIKEIYIAKNLNIISCKNITKKYG